MPYYEERMEDFMNTPAEQPEIVTDIVEVPNTPVAKPRNPWKILTVIFAALMAVFIVISLLLVKSNSDYKLENALLGQSVEDKEQDIKTLEGTVSSYTAKNAAQADEIEKLTDEKATLDEELASCKTKITSLEKDSKALSKIYTFLQRSDAGRADYKFKADTPIMVFKKGSPAKSFMLTTAVYASYGFKCDDNKGVVDIQFSRNSWSGGTVAINVTPQSVGTATYTFTNTGNSDTFKIMFIVVD